MKVSELLNNKFGADIRIRIFANGTWDNGGTQVWCFTLEQKRKCPQNVMDSNVTYMTVDKTDGSIIVECDAAVYEITKMLTISSGHVSEDTYNKILKDPDINEMTLPIYTKDGPNGGPHFGLYIYLDPTCIEQGKRAIPDDLMFLINLALQNGCDILCLDGDGPEYDNIPLYDWD